VYEGEEEERGRCMKGRRRRGGRRMKGRRRCKEVIRQEVCLHNAGGCFTEC